MKLQWSSMIGGFLTDPPQSLLEQELSCVEMVASCSELSINAKIC